jgi:hypothetical protein
MGFELTQNFTTNMLILMVVLLIFFGIIAVVNPGMIGKVERLGELFEPGRVYVSGGVGKYTSMDCSENIFKLVLKSPVFMYKKEPNDKTEVLEFLVILDYNGMLFKPQNDAGDDIIVRCAADEENFKCPDDLKLNFLLRGTGAISGNQTFHFTTWKARKVVQDELAKPETTLYTLLDKYYDSYLSSFDSNINVDNECTRFLCTGATTKESCAALNQKGCYWTGSWVGADCELCPPFTECSDLDKEQCTQCPAAKTGGCSPGILWGCEKV